MDEICVQLNEHKKMTRAVKRRSCSVGFFMLFSMVSSFFISQLYYDIFHGNIDSITRVFGETLTGFSGISSTEAFVISKTIISSGVIDILFSMISMLVTLFLPALLLSKMWSKSMSECFVADGKIVKGALFIYAFCQFVMMCTTNIADGMWGFLFPGTQEFVEGVTAQNKTGDVFLFVITILCTCILVPVIEEYVFRGVIFSIFKDVGTSFAIVASALCFGLMHSDVKQCMYAVTFGLFSAIFVVATGNIKTSVLFHMLNNLITVSNSYIPQFFGENVYSAFDIVYTLYVVSFAFYGMFLFLYKKGILQDVREKCNKEDELKKEKATLKNFFTLPVLIFVVWFAIEAFLGVVI